MVAGKKYEGDPLTRTVKKELDTQPIIQFTPNRGMPIWISKSLRKVQFTLSKDLTRSSFKTKTLDFLVLIECRNSWVMPTGSVIYLSLRKLNCWGDIDLLRVGFSWRATILEMTL